MDLHTKGFCILCFSQVKSFDAGNQSATIDSFKHLLSYLKINICELKCVKNSPYSSVDNNNVTLSLCHDCGTKAKNFSEQHIAWLDMGRKLELCVQDIHNQVLITDADPMKLDEYQRTVTSDGNFMESFWKVNVVVDLRRQAIAKCRKGMNFENLLNSTSHSPEQTNSSPARSSLGPVGVSSPAKKQLLHPHQDESITHPAPTTPFADNFVRDNEQPSTSRGLSPPPYQTQDQPQVGWMGGNSDYVDEDSDTGDEHEISFEHDEHMEEDEHKEGAVSPRSNCSSPIAPEVVVEIDEVVQEFVGEVNKQDFGSPATRPVRKRRTTNRDLPQNPDAHDCTICTKMFSCRRSLAAHMRLHNQKKRNGQSLPAATSYRCLNCSKVCQTRAGFIQHLRSHTGNKTPARVTHPEDRDGHFQCFVCPNSFSEDRTRRMHMAASHPWNYLQEILPPGVSEAQLEFAIIEQITCISTSPEGMEKKFPFDCLHCKRLIHGKADVRAHIVTKHNDRFKFTQKLT